MEASPIQRKGYKIAAKFAQLSFIPPFDSQNDDLIN